MITVVHTLKPSSLAHSLQIHCTGLTGLKSHSFWTWPEKRDPIALTQNKVLKNIKNYQPKVEM